MKHTPTHEDELRHVILFSAKTNGEALAAASAMKAKGTDVDVDKMYRERVSGVGYRRHSIRWSFGDNSANEKIFDFMLEKRRLSDDVCKILGKNIKNFKLSVDIQSQCCNIIQKMYNSSNKSSELFKSIKSKCSELLPNTIDSEHINELKRLFQSANDTEKAFLFENIERQKCHTYSVQ